MAMDSGFFHAACVDPWGRPIEFPGIGDTLPMTRESLKHFRKAGDFIDQLRASSADYARSNSFVCEFDVYPILMLWHPDKEGFHLAQFNFYSLSCDDHGVPVEKPPCTLLLCDGDGLASVGWGALSHPTSFTGLHPSGLSPNSPVISSAPPQSAG
jgi:hypothetical protein